MKKDYKAVNQLEFIRYIDKFQTITTTVSISENFASVSNDQGGYHEAYLPPIKAFSF